jgi:homoserine O-acetyltransferase
MKRLLFSSYIILLFTTLSFGQSNLQIADIGDLTLTSGKQLENCIVGYRTFGKLNEAKSNVIIFPTWFGGTSESIASLVVKHHFLDTTKYYVIAIDALGDGISSSPSNYQNEFPQITIRDMVNAEYKMLTEVLDIHHIFAAVGGSMGSMQVLEWAVAYPDFMDKIIAYVASPKMSGYDILWMNTQLNIIETLQKCNTSEREIRKLSDMMLTLLSRTPNYINEKVKTENLNEYLASFDKEPSKIFTLDDYVAQLKTMMNHNISLDYNGSMAEAAKAIKAKLFIIVSKTDMLVNPTEALNLAELTNAKVLILDNNCGHLAVSCELERCSKEISDFLDN